MIVRLMGGLGNQMWQYAFGVSAATSRHEDVFFNRDNTGRPYGLDAFVADVKFAKENRLVVTEPSFAYNPQVLQAPRGATFVGYWQTEKYLNEPLVRRAFRLRNLPTEKTRKIADDIVTAGITSAFIHVRRGDYLFGNTNVYHGVLPMDYYTVAVQYIKARYENPKFFVFSDEPDWCRANFSGDFVVVDHNGNFPHEDMWLMAQCKHGVIANSSFSWWGCWLGDNQNERICIAPKRWFAGANLRTDDLIPERWVKL